MSLRVAFQIDDFRGLNYAFDTSYLLMAESFDRGHHVYAYEPKDLSWRDGTLYARAVPLSHRPGADIPLTAGAATLIPLETMDIIHVRQNPPFDMAYLTAAYSLRTLPPTTVVANGPDGLILVSEKMSLLAFPDLMPPTLISQDLDQIDDFITAHGPVVLKPLYEFGGRGVMYSAPGDVNLKGMVEFFKVAYPHLPILVQQFIPDVQTTGDKRLFWLDSTVLGAFSRKPQGRSIRSNTVQGGSIASCTVTDGDRALVNRITPFLQKHHIYFAGLDLIGNYLTEINVTSPTGLRALERLTGVKTGPALWDFFETKIQSVRRAQ